MKFALVHLDDLLEVAAGDDHTILRMARYLNTSAAEVIGWLFILRRWQSEDGKGRHCPIWERPEDDYVLARAAEWPGNPALFVDCLEREHLTRPMTTASHDDDQATREDEGVL